MTLAQGIERVLNRTGLSDTADEFKDRARDYINMMLAEVSPTVDWWWLNRETTFDTVVGTRVYQPIAGGVTNWYSFHNVSNQQPLEIVGPDEYDNSDVDRNSTGTVWKVFVGGADATTGYPTVELWRVPSEIETIRLRYVAETADWTSSDDASNFITLGIPKIMESVLIYGAASLYMEENGDDTGAQREGGNLARALDAAKKQNKAMQGNRRYLPIPARQSDDALITLGTDTVS